jgi:hypothetical protein
MDNHPTLMLCLFFAVTIVLIMVVVILGIVFSGNGPS